MTTFDLVVLVVVGLFALWGAFTGFARQVGRAVAGVAAFFVAAPAGRFFGEAAAKWLKSSLTVGVVVASVVSFVVVFLVLGWLVTAVLRRVLAGHDPENRGADRALGFGLSGLKAASLVFVGVSAVVFVENNLVLGGKRYAFTPKDSLVAGLAREHNVIEWVQFGGARDLVTAAKLARDPKQAAALKDDPDYQALAKDPRFRQLLQGDAFKKALETGDVRGLMQNNQLVELVHDAKLGRHLERLAARAP